ncbi:hypothetical protein STCU_07274 [Strigomonas culicis]|uniref:C2 domain-containing protein n=1 Tax=Strigomonas culicis TaxID=28005 RepID=S9VM13_9TRYP|nr:hypothetical protein STCU_07274 [Strigomonas culicis]|eukprot:EPY24250.1 hypothetical protein STCU_07274 [Strigomonas culicis]
MTSLQIEILRGRHFPQTEDDPLPCTSQVRVTLMNNKLTTVYATEQCTSVQAKTNDPFFKDTLTFDIPSGVPSGVLVFKVFELERQKDSTPILCGVNEVSFTSIKHKDAVLRLSNTDPEQLADELSKGVSEPPTDVDPSLSIRRSLVKAKVVNTFDPDADCEIVGDVSLSGSCSLVPAGSQYVWLQLLTDKRWLEQYRAALTNAWRTRSLRPPAPPEDGQKAKAKPTLAEVRSVGDVVTKRWHCRRSHQVLTRVRLTAEKFNLGDVQLSFTSAEEQQYRAERKSRAFLIAQMGIDILSSSASNVVRDWLTRLWVLYTVGIDNDPAGTKVLSYDNRKRVHDSTFDSEDAVVLQGSLLYHFVSTLPYEVCQLIAEEDFRKDPLAEIPVEKNFDGAMDKVTSSHKKFTLVLLHFIGSLMDSITEAELAKILKAFKPAIASANERVVKGGKVWC